MTTARQLEQPITNLYDADFLAWIEDQVQALRTRKANSLDWDNILEELESMGRSEKKRPQKPSTRIAHALDKMAMAAPKTKQELGDQHKKPTA